MQSRNGATLFSASDLVNFMGCAHATVLDLRQLVAPVELPPEDDQTVLLQQKGLEHERAYLENLKAQGKSVIDIVGDDDIVSKSERTRAALREGADVIYQGAFLEGPWQGYSDFLLKVPQPSALGDYSYEVADTKLSRSATRRMHPDLCAFVSAAVYERRLYSAPGTELQCLLANRTLDPEAIAPAGLRFVFVDSLGCTQRSRPEADRLDRTYRALLGQRWRDRQGVERLIGVEDILVVSPFNMQVELLKTTLPAGARVGTVDKFQGQEAAVVLVSMATSSGDDLPRNIEFLYSRNRLNVAINPRGVRSRCQR